MPLHHANTTQDGAHTTCVPAERCLSQSPLFARCMSVVLPLMSTISHNPLVVQFPSHAPLAIPLVKTIWEHCSCLCETFLEAFALFSSPLLSPTLFLGFFSLESLCLVFHFQFWVSPRSECWTLVSGLSWTLSRTAAYTHHMTHPLQAVSGEDSGLTVNSEPWVLAWTLSDRLIGTCPHRKGKPDPQRTATY